MRHSEPTDGFRIAYRREGRGEPVILVHGSPGDNAEYADVVPLISHSLDVVVPDLRGFGRSDKHLENVGDAYSLEGQVKAVAALMDELGLSNAVLVGYDIGGFTVQTIAHQRPDLVKALVLSPPLPGVGKRILDVQAVKEFWHATFYQTPLVEEMIDGNRAAIREILRLNLSAWSGPEVDVEGKLLDHLTDMYAAPGAFTAGISWFRHPNGNPISVYAAEVVPHVSQRFAKPVSILWPRHDPLFPVEWSDRLDEFFVDYELSFLDASGHYAPLEAPREFADAILRRAGLASEGAPNDEKSGLVEVDVRDLHGRADHAT